MPRWSLLHSELALELRMSGCDFDDAMLAIQEAAGKITSVSTQIGNFDGKQDELLESVKVLTESVANLEDAARSSTRAGGKRQRSCVPLFERVSL